MDRTRLMNSPIHLSFRYLETDYVHALRAHYRARLRLPMDIAIILVVSAVGAYLWRLSDMHWIGVGVICVATAFAVLLIAIFTVLPPLTFRSDPKFRDEYSLSFSPQGIHFRTVHIDSQLQWNLYTSALVTAHSYVLYYGTRTVTVIPKRVFESGGQQALFEEMLTKNVPKVIRQ